MTDGVTAGTTTITSATAAFGTDVVGNLIYVSGGTGSVVADWYQITARTNATTITVDRSTGLTAGTGVTLNIGGAVANPGTITGKLTNGNSVYIKSGTYTVSSSTANISNGVVSVTATATYLQGYGSSRSDLTAMPVLSASGITACTLFSTPNGSAGVVMNIAVNGNSLTTIKGFVVGNGMNHSLLASNCTNKAFGFAGGSGVHLHSCVATGCSVQVPFDSVFTSLHNCISYANSVSGFSAQSGILNRCLSYGNTGATSSGFITGASEVVWLNCVAYGNGQHGFDATLGAGGEFRNCIAEGNAGFGFNPGLKPAVMINNAGYNNTSGNVNGTTSVSIGFIALTASPFVNAAGSNFSLNNNNPGGAQLRAASNPSSLPAGTSMTDYLDIGAVQHQDPAASPFSPLTTLNISPQ